MHRGGFCRFSMTRYSSDKNDLNDLGSHLTNVAAAGAKLVTMFFLRRTFEVIGKSRNGWNDGYEMV